MGTLKRRFVINSYKIIRKLNNTETKNKKKEITIKVKQRTEIERPTPIEQETKVQNLFIRQTFLRFKFGLGLFHVKRKLLKTKLSALFYRI